ncbi:Trm112 family protein [Litorimonas sp.]|uniref:Trm112 family protein n=1 Tax=Litorimonas sp. TaxID=1892381 RepID=UPI003A88EABC
MTETPAMDPKMLSVLICPKTGGPLSYDSDKKELVSKSAKLAFPVREGVPILLLDEARHL